MRCFFLSEAKRNLDHKQTGERWITLLFTANMNKQLRLLSPCYSLEQGAKLHPEMLSLLCALLLTYNPLKQ